MARRDRIPGVPVDAERTINAATSSLYERLRKLERRPGRAGMVLADVAAKPGEFLNVEAPTPGLTVILPAPEPALRNARVTLSFRNTNPVRITAVHGLVNGEAFVVNTAIGTFEAICNGLDGWAVETGVTSSGSAVDAHYILGQAHGSLPNGSVGQDTTLIDFAYTPGGFATWTFNTATFLALIDSTSILVNGTTLERAAITGAVGIPQNVNASTFEGLGFGLTGNGTSTAAVDETEDFNWTGTHAFTGGFVTVNVSGTAQLIGVSDVTVASSAGGLWLSAGHTPVVSPSVSNGDVLINATSGIVINAAASQVTGAATNTIDMTAADINVTASADLIANGAAGAVLASAAVAPTAVTAGTVHLEADGQVRITTGGVERLEIEPDGAWQLAGDTGTAGECIVSAGANAPAAWNLPKWATAQTVNAAGLSPTVSVNADTGSLRFSNGGATGIVTNIAAPSPEGQIFFGELTTGGGDEVVFVHDAPGVAAAEHIRTPGGRPYRFTSGDAAPMFYYAPASNSWNIIGPPGGHKRSLMVVNEDFDWAMQQEMTATPVPINIDATAPYTHTLSWYGMAQDTGTGDATIVSQDGILHHCGILRLTTTQVNTDWTLLFYARDALNSPLVTEGLYDAEQIEHFEAWVRVPTAVTTMTVLVGWGQDMSNAAGGTEFIGFHYNSAIGANWIMQSRVASSTSSVDSGVAATVNLWHKLEWYRYENFVLFYINRALISIFTDIPNGNGTLGVRVQTATTAARSVDVDRIHLEVREAALD